MSLQTMKLKINTSGTGNTSAKNNIPPESNSGFTLHGGPRVLNYIGKQMHNSKIRTPYKGIYPVNYTTDTKKNKNIVENCHITSSLRATAPANQRSVKNTKGMLTTKYKWIHGGGYPNYWVQPTEAQSYTDYVKDLRIKTIYECNDPSNVLTDCSPYNTCIKDSFTNKGVQLNHNPIDKLKNANKNIVKETTTLPTSSDHTAAIQIKCLDSAVFPYYTTNPGMRGGSCVKPRITEILMTPPAK